MLGFKSNITPIFLFNLQWLWTEIVWYLQFSFISVVPLINLAILYDSWRLILANKPLQHYTD